tara:strand:- start:370 stop:537 length:168 start_codon:yes stop_codon:yes gene_type:complete
MLTAREWQGLNCEVGSVGRSSVNTYSSWESRVYYRDIGKLNKPNKNTSALLIIYL